MIRYRKDISLLPFNTFGIDVKADHLFHLSDRGELAEIFAHPAFKTVSEDMSNMLILGQGSNILFTHDYSGVVIRNEIGGVRQLEETEEYVVLEAGAGVIWQDMVGYAVGRNLAGIENLTLIPGTVGAAPVQNIGAYGVEAAEVIVSVTGFHFGTRGWLTLDNRECMFGYRDSIFKHELRNRMLITSVVLKLSKELRPQLGYGGIREALAERNIAHPSLMEISDAVARVRRAKLPDPATLGNAGSFFKNPVVEERELEALQRSFPDIRYFRQGELYKIPAGWLIEQAGWKGYRLGDAGCYDRQALVLVNYGSATGEEILRLAEEIKRSVYDRFSINIEAEVNII
jgi:UDP-N-acetylmuramate dehydrogenase